MSVLVVFILAPARTVFPNRDFDALRGKGFAERRALNDAGELFGAKDLKDVRKARGQDRSGPHIEMAWAPGRLGATHIDKIHFQPWRASC